MVDLCLINKPRPQVANKQTYLKNYNPINRRSQNVDHSRWSMGSFIHHHHSRGVD
ncbi:hypothetical protein Hanom_Chr00s000007g01615351 [Helianthus anomalus]